MYCKNCGQQIQDDSQFCQYCGYSFVQSQNQQIQPPPPPMDGPTQAKSKKSTNALGIVGFVVSIMSFFIWVGDGASILVSLIAIVLCIIGIIKFKNEKKGLAIAGLIIGALVFLLSLVPKDNNSLDSDVNPQNELSTSSTTKPSNAPKPSSKSDEILSDGTIDVEINKCHVKYLRHEIVENIAGDNCLAVYYEFTNGSDKDKAFYVTVSDKAFQDGIELESSIFHVNDESHDSSAEIRPGVTITVCEGYVLRNLESDVELEVEEWVSLKDTPSDKMTVSIK